MCVMFVCILECVVRAFLMTMHYAAGIRTRSDVGLLFLIYPVQNSNTLHMACLWEEVEAPQAFDSITHPSLVLSATPTIRKLSFYPPTLLDILLSIANASTNHFSLLGLHPRHRHLIFLHRLCTPKRNSQQHLQRHFRHRGRCQHLCRGVPAI